MASSIVLRPIEIEMGVLRGEGVSPASAPLQTGHRFSLTGPRVEGTMLPPLARCLIISFSCLTLVVAFYVLALYWVTPCRALVLPSYFPVFRAIMLVYAALGMFLYVHSTSSTRAIPGGGLHWCGAFLATKMVQGSTSISFQYFACHKSVAFWS